MNAEQRFRALAAELDIEKDLVRRVIGSAHYPTDGAWKESLLRKVLEKRLPRRVVVGSGFIVAADERSSQIDILIYDSEAPLVERSGELVFVTPDAVRGIVEVKTTARQGEMTLAFAKLANDARIASLAPHGEYRQAPFVGLFAYGIAPTESTPEWAVTELVAGQATVDGPAISHVCLGPSFFVHYWKKKPGRYLSLEPYDRWHLYSMDGLAPGYFVSNVVESMAPESVRQNRAVWYPEQSKEVFVVGDYQRTPYSSGGD